MRRYIKVVAIMLILLSMAGAISNANDKTSNISLEKVVAENKIVEDGTYVIKSAINNDYVLDVVGASKVSGGNVQLYKNASADQQRFIVKYLDNGYYTITAKHSSKVLDVANGGKTAGTNVWQCTPNNSDAQKWLLKDAGNGYVYLVSKCNGLYLDVANGVAANGTNVQVCYGNNSNAQKFKFEKVQSSNNPTNNTPTGTKTIEDGTYVIKSGINNGYVLDVLNGSNISGANVQLYKNSSVNQQRFVVKYLDNGYYTITAKHSNKVLDVANGGKTAGTNVWQCTPNNSNAQKWVIKDAGNGYYYIISKCNGLYLDAANGVAANGTNIQVCYGNNSNAQKFKFEKYSEFVGTKTIEDGTYQIESGINSGYVLDVVGGSNVSGANVQLYSKKSVTRQRFTVKYLGDGFYTITAAHSSKVLDVANGGKTAGTNVWQCTPNNSDAQKWIIKDAGNGYYYLISKCNGLYLDAANGVAANGTNIQVCYGNNSNAQKFKFVKPINMLESLDESKYPGYKERISALMNAHPNWNFEFLYTGIKFSDAVAGEYQVRKRNLVPTEYGGEWISGTTLYDTGWYGASEKAIAYYMDPRNFLNDTDVFQFQDVNEYLEGACTLDGLKSKVANSFLVDYATDINTACLNQNVNPYYIIARLFQENGTNPKSGTHKMDAGNGKYYYNPFNIGATGDSLTEVYNNALATAKRNGWDTMVKALEGGIKICKENWLDNYQNTLYQNRFDIDSTNGTSLYTHQYMQNLMGAYSEARILRSSYSNTGKLESNFTFQIPLYEGMDKELSPIPKNNQESYAINVKTTGTSIRIREDASTDSKILREIPNAGTVLLSVKRGINSNWQQVITTDGLIGYVSGTYLEQIDDVKTCNYKAKVKTNDGNGCNVRIGPSTRLDKVTALSDGVEVTVIDNSTYKNIDGYDWSRVVLSSGTQVFIPSRYLAKIN